MPRKTTDIILENVHFTGIADRGKAVGRTSENLVVFASGPVPGDVADVIRLKKRKGVFQGIVSGYRQLSKDRVEAFCSHFETCGGCKWQHLDYRAQLYHKELLVKDAFQRIAKVEPAEFLPILGCEETRYYRNKLEYSFSNKRWLTEQEVKSGKEIQQEKVLGFHAPGSFDKIVAIENCFLQAEPSNEIRNFIRDFTIEKGYSYWDAKKHTGLMRNMIIRTAGTGELMLTLVFSQNDGQKIHALLDAVKDRFPGIRSLYYVVNEKLNDTLFDQEFVLYHGDPEIREKLGDLEFLISPKSFFQTNTRQSRALYDIAVEFAGLTGHELVYDLYTGLGSIALYMAGQAGMVIGIELVEEAIEDARRNATRNGITNARFHAGDVKEVLTDRFEKPDLVVVDPPRAGLHKEVVETILRLSPGRIVYVSCNPATQARDVALFHAGGYELLKLRPVDMFPHTHHIESVALLAKRD